MVLGMTIRLSRDRLADARPGKFKGIIQAAICAQVLADFQAQVLGRYTGRHFAVQVDAQAFGDTQPEAAGIP